MLGAPFAVAEFVEGTTVRLRADLDEPRRRRCRAPSRPGWWRCSRPCTGWTTSRSGWTSFGRPDGYASRQIRRWSGQWDLLAGDDRELASAGAKLSARLAAAAPTRQSVGIVHGDFRIDNTLLDLDGSPSVAAVLDWELSTIGDPVADVAMMCAYRHPAFDLIVGAPSAWTSDRLPSADDLAAAYEAAGGVALTDWEFHLALAYFKIGVIAAGIDHRRLVGSGAGPGFDTAGLAVAQFFAASNDQLRVRR